MDDGNRCDPEIIGTYEKPVVPEVAVPLAVGPGGVEVRDQNSEGPYQGIPALSFIQARP